MRKPKVKVKVKDKNPYAFLSSKYPFLHLLKGNELTNFYIDELDCSYGRCMGGLKKAWKGYKIARGHGDLDNQRYYASIIQNIQKAIGLDISDFSHIEIGIFDDFEGK